MAPRNVREVETCGGRTVEISSPDKVYFPELGATKFELASYYLDVADALLRTAGGRPALLAAVPRGRRRQVLLPKAGAARRADWLQTTVVTRRTARPRTRSSSPTSPTCCGRSTWAASDSTCGRTGRTTPTTPTSSASTSTPSPGVGFDEVRESATGHVRALLDELGIVGYPKTTGNRGIHVYVRLDPRWDSFRGPRRRRRPGPRARAPRHPDLITANWWKEERGARVFVDFNQNAPHKTVFGAWFARPRVGGQVSTPLTWDEVDDGRPGRADHPHRPRPAARARGPLGGDGDDPQSLQPLLDMAERDRANGLHDAPWPPEYPKQPDEPTRVAPSRAKKGP